MKIYLLHEKSYEYGKEIHHDVYVYKNYDDAIYRISDETGLSYTAIMNKLNTDGYVCPGRFIYEVKETELL